MIKDLTADEAAAIWSGDTTSLQGFDSTNDQQQTAGVDDSDGTDDDKQKEPLFIDDKDITNMFASVEDDDDDDDDNQDQTNQSDQNNNGDNNSDQNQADSKKGRKASDIISLVNELIESEELYPFEDGEIKTLKDAKDLIKFNLKQRESVSAESVWKEKVKSYSPQVQAILHYAEQGGKDISSLMGSISQIEETAEIDIETPEGQEQTVREVLRAKGFDNEDIEDEISTLKDLDKLKAKAEKFFPTLQAERQREVQAKIKDQEDRRAAAAEASRKYLQTIQTTLEKEAVGGIKLNREDKSKIYQALADARYTSLSGNPTNGFVKALEEMQFGENADYDHFANVVHFAIDKKSFLEKIKNDIAVDVNAETARKLRTQKNTTPNSTENVVSSGNKKTTITRSTFKNPFG